MELILSADWTYNKKKVDRIPDQYEGFVYIITNTTNNMKYIGKKLAKFKITKPPLKGRKNKRRGYKESDWKTYWGSSDQLKADVEELGEDKFTREILQYCSTKNVMNYIEAELQFKYKVLLSKDYYNKIINCRIGGANILEELKSNYNLKL